MAWVCETTRNGNELCFFSITDIIADFHEYLFGLVGHLSIGIIVMTITLTLGMLVFLLFWSFRQAIKRGQAND